MTENVTAFIAMLAGIVRKAGIGRIAVRVVQLLRYLFACHPIGECNRAHAPAQGIEQEDDEYGNDDLLNGDVHDAHYIIVKIERCLGHLKDQRLRASRATLRKAFRCIFAMDAIVSGTAAQRE